MQDERRIGGKSTFLAGFLLVSALIYFRPQILSALGYGDSGTPRTIFIVGTVVLISVVWLVGYARPSAVKIKDSPPAQ